MKPIKSNHPIQEYSGFWWIPNDPENQYFGNLKIDESGEIYLQIFGNSRSAREEYLDLDYNVLYGVCENNTKITVFNKYRSKGLSASFFTSSIEYRYCLIGFHIEGIHEIKFNEIHVNISDLFGWFVNFEIELLQQRKNRHFIEKELYQDSDRSISICAMNAESSSAKTRRIEIQRKGYLKIKYKHPAKYYEIFEELKLISMLMSILGRDATVVQEILIPYEENKIPKKAYYFVNNQTYFRPVVLRSFKNKHGRHIIADKFGDVFQEIYNLNESEKFILEVLSDKYLRSPGNERTEFFNIVSAYESWHRNNISETDDANVNIYHEIIDLVKENNDLKEWIGSRSILFKGMSLPKRLDYLMEQDEWVLISNQKKFKTIVSTTRNMIAHNLKKSKNSANFAEIIIIQNIIHSILEVLFLKSLKFPQGFISSHVQNHPIIERTILQIDANRNRIRF